MEDVNGSLSGSRKGINFLPDPRMFSINMYAEDVRSSALYGPVV